MGVGKRGGLRGGLVLDMDDEKGVGEGWLMAGLCM